MPTLGGVFGARRAPWAIALFAFAVYLANFRVTANGDNVASRYLPFALWQGSLYLDPVREVVTASPRPFWVSERPGGRLAPSYPVVLPVLLAPFYAPAAAYVAWRGPEPWRLERVAVAMEKLSAAAISAATAGLLFGVLRRFAPAPRAALLVAAYAFGTSTWAVASQALWTHGLGQLLLTAVLWLRTAASRPIGRLGGALFAGACAGLMVANRAPSALLAAPIVLALAFEYRRRAVPLVGAALLAYGAFAALYFRYFGHVLGWYGGPLGLANPRHIMWQHSLLLGMAGQLLSPAKGLLPFSPWLLAILSYADRARRRLWRRPDLRGFRVFGGGLALGSVLLASLYALADWRGGYCYGPRYLLDILPAAAWFLAPLVARWSRRAMALFAAAVVFSVAVQVIGAFCYPRGASDEIHNPPDLEWWRFPPAVWEWRNYQPWLELRGGLAEPDLLPGRWRVRPEWSGRIIE